MAGGEFSPSRFRLSKRGCSEPSEAVRGLVLASRSKSPRSRWLRCTAAGLVLLTAVATSGKASRAEEGSRYVHENGQTYLETQTVERVPETTVRTVRREETTYRPQYVTEYRESPRVVWTPVSEFRCEPRWHNVLNPFSPAYVAYHMVPTTRWEMRTETIRTPVTYRELVPETKVVDVPTRELRFVEREVIRRVAVTPTSQPIVATRIAPASDQVGVALLEGDPPRRSTAPIVGRGGVTIIR